jgi:UDP-N-acetylglucosamine acyltransferase
MSANIHSSAIVHPDARLGDGVEIGAFAIVGEGCTVGDGCVIAARATLEKNVTLGTNVKVGIGSVLGGDPQDLKFKGEHTTVEIGENTVIREYATINRGTAHSFKTTVGKNCFLMSYVHLAHDCHVGDGVIISNGTQLAGHVTIDEKAIVSGLVAVHQFATIGRYSFIGGCSRVAKDVPPYVKAVGNPRQPDQAVRIE